MHDNLSGNSYTELGELGELGLGSYNIELFPKRRDIEFLATVDLTDFLVSIAVHAPSAGC